MGWWDQSKEGYSLQEAPTGLIWGDEPADILSDAIDRIDAAFKEKCARPATMEELIAGLRFSTGSRPREEATALSREIARVEKELAAEMEGKV